MEHVGNVDLFDFDVQNEEHSHYKQHAAQDPGEDILPEATPQQIDQGEDNGNGCNRQTPEVFVGAFFGFLPFGLQYVEKCQTGYSAKAVQTDTNQANYPICAQAVTQKCGEHTKADHVAEGVQLDTEGFFILGAVFLGAGHGAVEGIADAGQQQADDGGGERSLGSKYGVPGAHRAGTYE